MFQKLKKDYDIYEDTRQLINGRANFILHKAKQSIFALHRGEIKKAENFLKEVEKDLNILNKHLSKIPPLKYNGLYKAALEEYTEAKLFWQVLKFGKIKEISKVQVNFDDYLGGICDLTGELVRKMVLLATENKFEEIFRLKTIITDIINGLIKIDLTGYLRHKFDEAKRNLEKAEQIVYELKMMQK